MRVDTETGVATFYDFNGIEKQELIILPYALELINENLKADPTGLEEWGKPYRTTPIIEEQQAR